MGVLFTRGNRVFCHVCHSSVQNPGCQRLEQTADNCGPGSAKRLEKRGFDCLTDSFGRVERESHPLCNSQFERGTRNPINRVKGLSLFCGALSCQPATFSACLAQGLCRDCSQTPHR